MMKTKAIALSTLLIVSLATTVITTLQSTLTANAADIPYTETNGILSGANYTIRFPNPIQNWNGMVVLLCRGYLPSADLGTGRPLTTLPQALAATATFAPLASQLNAQGYAIAASNFGALGTSIQKGVNRTYELTQYVIKTYNVKGKVFLIGTSMGGAIALLLGQKYPNIYSGVLDLSGKKDYTNRDYYAGIAAAQNDSELIAKLQAIHAVVPPYPFSVYPPPLSNQLRLFQNFTKQATSDTVKETGGTLADVPQAYAKISAVDHADISIPMISLHGTSDALVPFSEALAYQSAVAAAGKSSLFRLYTVQGAQHVDSAIMGLALQRFLELVGWSGDLTNALAASAFYNVTLLTGWKWYFFAQSSGGAGSRTYQWYEGTTLLQGQTDMVLAVTKTTPGVYNYSCKVTDSTGTFANSNTVTLTVIN